MLHESYPLSIQLDVTYTIFWSIFLSAGISMIPFHIQRLQSFRRPLSILEWSHVSSMQLYIKCKQHKVRVHFFEFTCHLQHQIDWSISSCIWELSSTTLKQSKTEAPYISWIRIALIANTLGWHVCHGPNKSSTLVNHKPETYQQAMAYLFYFFLVNNGKYGISLEIWKVKLVESSGHLFWPLKEHIARD